ncbi:MAG: chemotaxis protein CheD [Deltaproteobacteria bacterium]|nr:chemotaxis protein CheD [Deltaproteobacteria bacterium]
MLFAKNGQCVISTILGSCVAVCLWDNALRQGGMNHYLLPLWNGEGLPTPKYGNVAIPMLIEKMRLIGSRKENLVAKVFGGGSVLESLSGPIDVGSRNIALADEMLSSEKISVVSSDLGGNSGRKIFFVTGTGEVFVRKFRDTKQGS